MKSLEDKVIIVTGGVRRIGETITRHLHSHGAHMVVHYNTSFEQAHILQDQLNEIRKDSITLLQGDLRNIAAMKNTLRNIIYQMGRLDGLINNASRFYSTPLCSTNEDQWHDLIDTNLMAPYFLSQAIAPYLAKTQGSIINITDIYADRPLHSHSVYSASKAGLVSLTRSLASELGPQVRVNAIAPGAIIWSEHDNDEIAHQRFISATPLKRTGTPADIADAVYFLVTAADYITGQVINIDGGRSASV